MAIRQPLSLPTVQSVRKRIVMRPSRLALYAIVLFCVALFGFPLLWTLMASLKTVKETFAFPPVFFPAVPQFSNYVRVLSIERIPVLLWTWNAAYITVLTTIGTVITASLVGYSFARFTYRGRNMVRSCRKQSRLLRTAAGHSALDCFVLQLNVVPSDPPIR